jgi:CheY-like chemotaxis protein
MTDKKIKILCVEDEIDIRSNISDILRDEGYEVVEAGNGYEGFETFLSEKPDLIISDIMMPELDGYGLLKFVRDAEGFKNSTIPFIFLTALGQKDNVIKGVNLSANDYLVKPIDFDLLIAKVKEKTLNYQRIENFHHNQINNIKNQISLILPKDSLNYLDVITEISAKLKEEPYGSFPHRQYLDEIKKIYLNALNLRTTIHNYLDKDVIDFKLNANEESINLADFLENFAKNIDKDFSSRIVFNNMHNINLLPSIKIDKIVLIDALGNIIFEMLKNSEEQAKISIGAMLDHLKQIVIIINLHSEKNLDITQFNTAKISRILDKQNCRFEIVENRKNTAVLIIPDFRLI